MTPFTPQLYTPYRINFKQPMKLGCTRKPVTEAILEFTAKIDNIVDSNVTELYYKKPGTKIRSIYEMTPNIWENILAIGGSFNTLPASLSRDFKSEEEK